MRPTAIKKTIRKAKTGEEFIRLFKKFTPFGNEISFERDNITRPHFSFE